ncbi:ribosome small subunit-dependent GTPase A [Serinibacter arcticus]|uniref:Small ribosomal subunit biogenesis GTPase RsgA n=1 Tax=Serinibacter arcticus TaxID=1655435 RepID=A0A4Z1E2Y1_9MICO|nr:ribosome small subunit-dependent GTPase A [Serinibacter arcticus]TGO05600.1 putative GTPase related to EngC [Serinibacter arcticus]
MTIDSWRISRVDRTRVLALPDGGDGTDGSSGAPIALPLRPGGLLRAAGGVEVAPAVGDRLIATGGGPTTVPTQLVLAPRTSELVRDSVDRTSRPQVVAANVDVVLVVEPLDPAPSVGRVERLVTLAWRAGARPVVVLTKTDLVHDVEDWRTDVGRAAPGVVVVALSAATGEGLAELLAHVEPGSSLVVVGRSGAGKSTLVNALLGNEAMATGERRGDGKGRHTTTHRELLRLRLPDGGAAWLIDTPGLRAVGLVANPDAVGATFADVEELTRDCRFTDCAHEREPGCAVVAAIEDGSLPRRRFESYRAQHREAAYAERRADARLAADDGRDWRRRSIEKRQQRRFAERNGG